MMLLICSYNHITRKSTFSEYEKQVYFVKFDVTYNIGGTLAEGCLDTINKLLSESNATISNKIDTLCSILHPGNFMIESFFSTSLNFKVNHTLQKDNFKLVYVSYYLNKCLIAYLLPLDNDNLPRTISWIKF